MSLTDKGRVFYNRCLQILGDIERAEDLTASYQSPTLASMRNFTLRANLATKVSAAPLMWDAGCAKVATLARYSGRAIDFSCASARIAVTQCSLRELAKKGPPLTWRA